MKALRYTLLVSFLMSVFSFFLIITADKTSTAITAMTTISLVVFLFTILILMFWGEDFADYESNKTFEEFLRNGFPSGYSKDYITCSADCHILQSPKDILIVQTGYKFLKKYEIKDFTITNSVYDKLAILVIDDKRQKLVLHSLLDRKLALLDRKLALLAPKEANYEDLLSVTLKTDGQTISKKSTTRTLTGAAVGGALFGGAGAIVGGLSGDVTSTQAISKVIIKLTFRDIENPNFELVLFSGAPTKPNDIGYKDLKKALALGNKINDICSVIIDKVDGIKKEQPRVSSLSIAEELKKLSELVKEGIISQKEFDEQKGRLFNL